MTKANLRVGVWQRVKRHSVAAGLGWFGPCVLALLLIAALAAPAQAKPKTWYVANNGLDTWPCTKSEPCRSIGRALGMATPGDTVQVGPGIYGDLDGSGTVGDATGDEPPSSGCMITITSRVTLVSKNGTRSTVLDAGGDSAVHSVVCIGAGADGTVFGKLNKGFTLTGSTLGIIGGAGLTVSANDGVSVEGNWAANNAGYGFFLSGPTNTTLKSNIASGNGMSGVAAQATGLVLTGNLAKNNTGSGFLIDPGVGGVITLTTTPVATAKRPLYPPKMK
jgi:parallel beta-helix repeat protein